MTLLSTRLRLTWKKETVLGIGTGSTANLFIDRLGPLRDRFKGAVASSEASAERLKGLGIEVFELNHVGDVPFLYRWRRRSKCTLTYDQRRWCSAHERKNRRCLRQAFICIADGSKYVAQLGQFPLPVEVIPMARSYVA